MTKDGQLRANKYAAKYDPTVVGQRYTATKDAAVLAAGGHQIAMGELAGHVRDFLNTAGVPPIQTVIYLSYANKLYGICNKFKELTAINEATVAQQKACDNGADPVVTAQIWGLFATLGEAPSPIVPDS